MTQPAYTLTGQQSKLALAISLGNQQAFIGEPFSPTLCTHILTLENKAFATADPTIQDIISCDGQNLADQKTRQWRGAFTAEFFATSEELGWALATAWGAAGAAGSISASNAVFSLAVSATGGTFRLDFDGRKTAPIAWNASSAVINTAIDAALGAVGLVVSTGSSPTYTLTAASTYLNTEVRPPVVRTQKLTGGSAALTVTTWGGPARKSYAITQDSSDQPPAITAVLGYSGGTAWQLADLVVDSLQISLEDSGLFRVQVSFIWNGFFEKLASFSWPACTLPDTLEGRDSTVLIGAVDHGADLRAIQYTFNNRIQLLYTTISRYPDALLRQFPLGNQWTASFQEDVTAVNSVYGVVTANNQDGTKTSFSPRMGLGSDGATFANAESIIRINGTVQEFGGTPPLGRVPAAIQPLKSDATATKPTSATVITLYAGGYLAAV